MNLIIRTYRHFDRVCSVDQVSSLHTIPNLVRFVFLKNNNVKVDAHVGNFKGNCIPIEESAIWS